MDLYDFTFSQYCRHSRSACVRFRRRCVVWDATEFGARPQACIRRSLFPSTPPLPLHVRAPTSAPAECARGCRCSRTRRSNHASIPAAPFFVSTVPTTDDGAIFLLLVVHRLEIGSFATPLPSSRALSFPSACVRFPSAVFLVRWHPSFRFFRFHPRTFPSVFVNVESS